MNVKPRWIEPKFALLSAGVLAVILYGSLYPFQFHRIGVPWTGLLSLIRFEASGTDVAANVLLYWPLGLTLFLALPRIAPGPRAGLIVVSGGLLALSMELAQIYDVGRLISWGDVLSDTAGAAAGAITAAIFRGRTRAPYASLMLASWLGYQLFPYAILAGWPQWRGDISALGLAQRLVVWLAVALLLGAQAGAGRSRPVFAGVMLVVLLLQSILSGAALPREQLWSGALALPIWNLWLWKLPRRAVLVAALLFIYAGVDAMRPFQFLTEPREFGWIPFYSFLVASREAAVYAFLEKAFLYGTLVWALARAGLRPGRATLAAAGYVLLLRLAQTYLPGRSAEITDALMVLGLGGVLVLLWDGADSARPQGVGEATNRYPTPRTVTR